MAGKRIALVLSGCGNKDGTEITECVALIVSLTRGGAKLEFFSLSEDCEAKNFLTEDTLAPRNMMVESARISRSQMKDLKELKAEDFDALAFPGGSGAAKNLCNWTEEGANCSVHPEVRRVIEDFYAKELPIAAVCIAPVLLAKVLGHKGISLTLGAENEITQELRKTGATHEVCPVNDFITDRVHKIISTPAYMYGAAKPFEVFDGIEALAQELLEMA